MVFENYDQVWIQIHEMVTVEKGNAQQFPDEIDAYADLVPQGNNLGTCTIRLAFCVLLFFF